MKRCPECGNITDDSAVFCPRCGCMLPSTPDYSIPPTYRPVRRRNGIPIAKLVAVMAIAAILMAAAMSAMNLVNNTSEYGERTIVYDWHVSEPAKIKEITFKISLTIPEDEIKAARDSSIDRSGLSTNTPSAGGYAVKDYVVVSDTIRKLANDLWVLYSDNVINSPFHDIRVLDSPELFANYVLAFVHNAADYETDSSQFGEDEYWLYPIETLYYMHGDCEDTSILAAALYSAFTDIEGAKDRILGTSLFLLPGHAMVGVNVSGGIPASDSTYKLDVAGTDYYFGETTIDGTEKWMGVGELDTSYYGAYVQGFVGTSAEYVK